MSTVRLSAANRLRTEVLKVPGTVLISRAGHPDQVIRFERVPEFLEEFKKPEGHYFINMDRGPDQEAWQVTMRDIQQTARRDRPIPVPIPVAVECKEEWSVNLDQVPVVENGGIVTTPVSQPSQVMRGAPENQSPIIKCDVCTMDFNSDHALRIHKGRAHKR